MMRVSQQALDGNADATAVVMDASTGAVIVDVSTSSPNPQDAWEAPPNETAVDGRFAPPSRLEATPPGSVFKVFLAAAALGRGIARTPELGSAFEIGPDDYIHNQWLGACPDTTVATMIAESCNTSAAFLAGSIGERELVKATDEIFGFNQGTIAGLTATPSTTGLTESSSAPEIARSGFGQQDVRMTPLGLTQAVAQIANPASAPGATYIAGSCDSSGFHPSPPQPATGIGLERDVAASVLDFMRLAVSDGTARRLSVEFPEQDLAAKTGSAEDGRAGVHGTDSWIAVILDSRWVVTVVVRATPSAPDPASTGAATTAAIPIVRKLLEASAWKAPECPGTFGAQ
jgi:peptidoglycan glycosyltransferase